MDPANVPAELEVRSFTRSWDNRGGTYLGQFCKFDFFLISFIGSYVYVYCIFFIALCDLISF